jgi:exodeoxyribonuclease VII large subunit
VSDLRAPTPSAAAELAAPDVAALTDAVAQARVTLAFALQTRLADHADQLDDMTRRLAQRSPIAQLDRQRLRVDEALRRASTRVEHLLTLRRAQAQGVAARLATLDPQATLGRGYALVTRANNGQLVTSPEHTTTGERLHVQLRDGAFDVVRDG